MYFFQQVLIQIRKFSKPFIKKILTVYENPKDKKK